MAYNNIYPVGYQPFYQPQPTLGNGIIWVQGEAGAKSYLIAPNQSVTLWDSESQTIYIKSADASGLPSIKVLDYTFRDNPPVQNPSVPYATRDEVEQIRKDLASFRERYESLLSYEDTMKGEQK